jgi:hypothetical protein
MKKYLLPAFLIIPSTIFTQNIQLHYDLGKPENGDNRNFFVGTAELYKPDSLGYTFLFADFEFDSPNDPRGVSSGYFEIAREFYIPWFRDHKTFRQLALHIEYNDGVAMYQVPDDSITYGANINSAWLLGAGYPLNVAGFTLNTIFLYKYIRGSRTPDFQLTLAWYHLFLKDRITLSGFVDFWTQDNSSETPVAKTVVFYAEPQFWFNFNRHFSIGSELKLSKNFIPGSTRFEAFPTLAAQWNF